MFYTFTTSDKSFTKNMSLKKNEEISIFNVCLGELLREIRIKDMGIKNQRDLSRLIGISQPSISKAESGETTVTVYLLYKYCDLAGIDHKEAIVRLDNILNERK